jgi:Flp pilus assembly protein TadG
LSISIILAALFGVIYVSMALYTDHFVGNAAKEATRYAMVRGSSWNGAACTTTSTFSCTATSTDITNYVESTMPPGLTTNDLTVTTTWPGTGPSGSACDTTNGNNSPYCSVSVKVSYSFEWFLPFLPQNTLQLTSNSTVAITE